MLGVLPNTTKIPVNDYENRNVKIENKLLKCWGVNTLAVNCSLKNSLA